MMTVEENQSAGLVVDQLKFLLNSLPVSRAALKKNETSNVNNVHNVSPEIEKKITECEKDEDLILDLNDNVIENIEDENADQEVPSFKSSRVLCSISPVSLLMEFSQKNRDAPTVVWNEFSKNGLFGCKVNFGEKFWIIPAEYSRKKEARTMVALMACTELIGDDILYENVDLKKYESWTKESVREMSDALAEMDNYYKQENSIITKIVPRQSKLNISKSNTPLISATCNDSISYVSLVNEICQKLQISLPVYNLSAVNSGSILKFRCSVENFSECPNVCTDPFTSKRMAKNEAAKQIYEHLQMIGKLDSNTKSKKQNVSERDGSSNEIISVIKNLLNSDPDAPIDPVTLIPLVMSLLTHISQHLYPEKI